MAKKGSPRRRRRRRQRLRAATTTTTTGPLSFFFPLLSDSCYNTRKERKGPLPLPTLAPANASAKCREWSLFLSLSSLPSLSCRIAVKPIMQNIEPSPAPSAVTTGNGVCTSRSGKRERERERERKRERPSPLPLLH